MKKKVFRELRKETELKSVEEFKEKVFQEEMTELLEKIEKTKPKTTKKVKKDE